MSPGIGFTTALLQEARNVVALLRDMRPTSHCSSDRSDRQKVIAIGNTREPICSPSRQSETPLILNEPTTQTAAEPRPQQPAGRKDLPDGSGALRRDAIRMGPDLAATPSLVTVACANRGPGERTDEIDRGGRRGCHSAPPLLGSYPESQQERKDQVLKKPVLPFPADCPQYTRRTLRAPNSQSKKFQKRSPYAQRTNRSRAPQQR